MFNHNEIIQILFFYKSSSCIQIRHAVLRQARKQVCQSRHLCLYLFVTSSNNSKGRNGAPASKTQLLSNTRNDLYL